MALGVARSPTPIRKSIWKRLLIVVTGLGAVFGAVWGAIQIYDRVSPHPPNVIVEHFWSYSPIMESQLTGDPPTLSWQVAFSITNLEPKTVALVGLDPWFAPVSIDGMVWQVNAKGGSLVSGQAFESEAELYKRTVGHEDWESAHERDPFVPDPRPPFPIKPGEKQYFLFQLMLPVYHDGELCRYDVCVFKEQIVVPTKLVGGHIDRSGRVWCIDKDVPFTIRLDDGRLLQRDLRAEVGVVGCTGPILEKSPEGGVHFAPIPE
jgi:hypothetical protein